MNIFFNKSISETLNQLETNADKGLTKVTAQERLKKYGENKLQGKKGKSIFEMFLDQFKDFLVIILIVTAVVSIVAMQDYKEGIIILAIVILNAVLGVTQESKASNALKALQQLSSPTAKILRDGELVQVQSEAVVVGDIVILDAGDYIPADLRLIETINLKADESALTGESVPVEKKAEKILPDDAGLGDRTNSAYMGTIITYGRGKGVVVNTGMNTQMGSIASMLSNTADGATPLQKKLDSFGKKLGIGCLAICFVIFILGLFRDIALKEIFMTAIALAVAAIPEGLTVVVTVILAVGMQKMVKINAIVKKLSAVETLGSTTVICSDKTGTLTQNKMTVLEIFDGKDFYDVSGTGYSSDGTITTKDGKIPTSKSLQKLLEGAALCNDSIYKKAEKQIIGDPTEAALLVAGEKYNISSEGIKLTYPRIQEIPFDSDRKLMSTFHEIDSKVTMYTKGAPDEIVRRSAYIYRDGKTEPITEKDRQEIMRSNENYAKNALRVLGLAFKETAAVESLASDVAEQNLVFVGLLGMIDPPREEVRDAVETCKHAGIQVKMITGDHKITASAIAEQIGIVPVGTAVEGKEIDTMTDERLRQTVKTASVFARVSPEHKVRLVDAIKANGNIVAMTGDGVNDAPSLKKADIGVAMGITGTDVSKEAADMILTDDNFATIVHSVEEGRTIYGNIRKVIAYLLSCNIGEILLIFVAMLIGLPTPLGAVQLLSINLITDAFPAFALGMEAKDPLVMEAPPRDPNESIVNKKMMVLVAAQSIFLGVACLLSYIYGHFVVNDEQTARTMCFVTIVLEELLRAYSSRSDHILLIKMNPFSNSFLNKSVLASLAFLILCVYVPFLQGIFDTHSLDPVLLAISLGFAILALIGDEIAKMFVYKMKA